MGQVRVFTAARSKQIEDTTVVGGYIDGLGNLILQTRIGGEVNAGPVIGPQGIPGNGFNSVHKNVAFDFNDIKLPGLYHITLNDVAAACTNGPTYAGFNPGQAGYLLVEGNGTTNIKQTWTNYNVSSETLVRSYYAGWFAWLPPIEIGSETQEGISRLATSAETQTGTSRVLGVTPFGLAARTATETRTGIVELATTTEAATGKDTTRAVTAAGLKNAVVLKWRAAQAYVVGDRVLSPTDELVTCLTAHTASATFPPDILKWSYSAAPRGLMAYSQNVTDTGQLTVSTILLTIASFTFRANRSYRVVANLGYYASGVSTTASFTINRAATSDAASSTSGLTAFAQVTNRPNVSDEGRFDIISRDNLIFTTDQTYQIKLMLQPLNSTNYYVAQASAYVPMTLSIYDDGILS